jgi:aryl-alcohol dehydrogenase-like predicted oxidoreductase
MTAHPARRLIGGWLRTRKVGGLDVSVVGLGTNNFGTDFFGGGCDVDDATRIISAAFDAGVNFMDTAEEYSVRSRNGSGQSEQLIGVALKRLKPRRDEFVVATKFLNEDLDNPDERGSRRIVRALELSLKRLNLDYVDLYQQHRPDPGTPVEETLVALDELVRAGKVREIGCSNFAGSQIDEAEAASTRSGLVRFVTTQSRYNVLENPREEGVLEACQRSSVMLLPYYPLASGLLTGKYGRPDPPPPGSRLTVGTPISDRMKSSLLTDNRLRIVRELESFARSCGRTLLELAISWLTSQPLVLSVITGATRPDQITANAFSASWELSASDFNEVGRIVRSQS